MPSSRVSGVRFEQLLQNASEPAFWLNRDLRLVWVNRAWESVTGHAGADVIGTSCHPHGPTRPGEAAGLGGSLYPPREALEGRPTSARTMIVRPGGERLWKRIEFLPFHADDGVLSAVLGILRESDEPTVASESETQRLRTELMELRDRLLTRYRVDTLVGSGQGHRRLLDQVSAAAASNVPVLILGETGTGKRLVARTIHQLGPRQHAPLVPLDCAALPAEVIDRELFGVNRASVESEPPVLPRLILPEGATLLIGDVLDLPRDLQGRLAAALDGPVRLLATSVGDPDAALKAERLRSDFYYALTTFVIRLIPLRERLDELPLLAQHLLERANMRGGRQRGGYTDDALRTLAAYDWPGNLRELARVVDASLTRGESDLIDTPDLPAAIRGSLASAYSPPPLPASNGAPLDELLTQVERKLIENALQRARDNKSKAADHLGISRPRLYRRIKELGIAEDPDQGDEGATDAGGRD